MIVRLLLAATLGGAVLTVALRGGSYDIVPRHETFVIVWWVAALGAILGLLPRARPRGGVLVAAALLGALALWTAAGLAWTESDERTTVELARTLGLAGVLLLLAWTFHDGDREAAVSAVTVAAVAVCVLAMASRLAPDVVTSALVEAGYGPRRLSYALNYWNALGVWAVMTFSLTLGWSAHAAPWWVRGAALGSSALTISVCYLTYSRTAAVSVVVAVVAVVALSSRRWLAAVCALLGLLGGAAIVLAMRRYPAIAQGSGTDGAAVVAGVIAAVFLLSVVSARLTAGTGLEAFRVSPRAARRMLAGSALVLLVAGSAFGPQAAARAWESFGRASAEPADDLALRFGSLGGERRLVWAVALDAFAAHPVKGTGAGTYEFVWNRDLRRSQRVRDAHSVYFEALAELGIAGGVLVVAVFGALLFTAVRTTTALQHAPSRGAAAGCAGAVAVFCVAAGVDWMWESTAVLVLAVVLAGLAAGGVARPGLGLRAWPRVGVALVALAALATALPGLVGTSSVRDSAEAVRANRLQDALADAAMAVDVRPWAASGYLQRARVLERIGLLGSAAGDARRATVREPTNWEPRLLLARIEAERGRLRVALREAERARRLNPRSPIFAPRQRVTGG